MDDLLDKMLAGSERLGEICDVNAGVHAGMDKISKKIVEKYPNLDYVEGEGVFVLSEKEAENFKEKEYLKPMYKSLEINRYTLLNNRYYLIYSTPYNKIDSWYYLRRGVKNSKIYSSGLAKIITSYRVRYNSFSFTEEDCFGLQDTFYITQPKENYNLKFLLGVLNSKLIYKWLYYRGKRKGEMLELTAKPLSEIPIPTLDTPEKQQIAKKIEELVEQILERKTPRQTSSATPQEGNFGTDDVGDPADSTEGNFGNANPQERNLETDTANLEKEVDDLVFDLYGLTDEERGLVLGGEIS